MNSFFKKLSVVLKDRGLRTRILVVIGMLVVFRLLSTIPVPGVDTARLSAFLSNNQFFGILNIFSGGGLSNLSIMMLGVGPYITSSIIMQLLTIMVPRLKSLNQEEGEAGRKKFNQYSRMITVPLAVLQGFSLLMLLKKQAILGVLTPLQLGTALAVVVAGSLLLTWIGEIMTEYGISNGTSIIIFAGIVSALPKSISQFLSYQFDVAQLPVLLAFLAIGLALILLVVYISEAERPIPVTYARQNHGGASTGGVSTYVPLRVNQAGVIPIIFALSIMLLPQMLGGLLALSKVAVLSSIGDALTQFSQSTWPYAVVYFALVFVFTYFYTAVTFDPHAMSENLQKSGAFVPGIRPGLSTEQYIAKIVSRITFVGALFLGIIAVLPLIVKAITGITAIALGGTAMLIVVSVILDLIKRIDAQISMHEY